MNFENRLDPLMKLIAFYLPQFHPIPENDGWWGQGFTEWTNVARARPRFAGHYQPDLPADLGFYDLRLPETREAQAELAREYGIYGFCYYHYWFAGRRLLERPLDEVIALGKPDFPFCICWANENWTRKWDGLENEVLIQQSFSAEDDVLHIQSLARVFEDPRYIRVEGKPLFLVYRAGILPDARATTDRWREEAQRLGLGGLFLCRVERTPEGGDPRPLGFDAAVEFSPNGGSMHRMLTKWDRRMYQIRKQLQKPGRASLVFDYKRYTDLQLADLGCSYPRFPCVFTSWDNSPRSAVPMIFTGSTPSLYRSWLRNAIERAKVFQTKDRFVFINAWNEWAEGAHLEPCQHWGRAYLEATRYALEAP
jgi:lipopolysaccharide biosynthesis protein